MTNVSWDVKFSIIVDTDDCPGGKDVKFWELPEDVQAEILDDGKPKKENHADISAWF